MRSRTLMLGAALALALGACGGKSKGPETTGTSDTAPTKSLYERIGGAEGISGVVEQFLTNVGADDRINARFAHADLKVLKTKLVEQICQASGGPCTYSGKNMKEAHVGMGITGAHFDALVEDLVKAFDTIGVKDPEKGELLEVLGGLKPEIVEK